jgi:1-acyl-sn-glycerol-3-phosphate acyltransferase
MKLQVFIKIIIFYSLLVFLTIGIALFQISTLVLLLVDQRKLYDDVHLFIKKAVGSYFMIIFQVYCPTKIGLVGNYQDLINNDHVIIMANHQIYTDWLYLWIFSWYFQKHEYITLVLKKSISKIPFIGIVLYFFKFIVLKRNWNLDKNTFIKSLGYLKEKPFWLMIFSEGTVVCKETMERTALWCKEKDMEFTQKYTLIPKSTGMYHIIQEMTNSVSHLYDITLIYPGDFIPYECENCLYPYDFYTFNEILFGTIKPKEIFIHVKKESVSSLSRLTRLEFDFWMKDAFMEKERLLDSYYTETQSIESLREIDWIDVVPKSRDYIDVGKLFIIVYSVFYFIYALF